MKGIFFFAFLVAFVATAYGQGSDGSLTKAEIDELRKTFKQNDIESRFSVSQVNKYPCERKLKNNIFKVG